MSRIRTLIIEDEENAIDLMTKIITEYCPEIEIIGDAGNISDAIQAIDQLKPEVVFLDVNLGQENSLAIMDHFPDPDFLIVFTTAYSEYAFTAYKINAVHYMLKPYSISEVKIAIEKIKDALWLSENKKNKIILINDGNKKRQIKLDEISYLMADRAYCKIFLTNNDMMVVSKPLSILEKEIDSRMFLRIHASYLINTKYIKSYVKGEDNVEMTHGVKLPVSRTRRDEVRQILLK